MRGLRLTVLALASLAFGFAAAPSTAQDILVEEIAGYRMDRFRSPVPDRLTGAETIGSDAAYALWRTGRVIFVDVLPQPPKPQNLPEGAIWREPVHKSIPGAIWLPNTGFGLLPPERDAYFRENLERLTGGNKSAPLVIFCLSDCWMSWNAAKRTVTEYGYDRVFWYPDGVDGWAGDGHPLEELQPVAP